MIRDLLHHGDPSKIAIIVSGDGPVVTYGELCRAVDGLAAGLHKIGLGPNDRIAMALPNGLELIAAFLAATLVGTAAPLNPAYKRQEFQFYLEDTRARAIILPASGAEEAVLAAGERIPTLPVVVDPCGEIRLESSTRLGPTPDPLSAMTEQPALILHTSGTTSRPKRVPLSRANIMASTRQVAETYRLTSQDVSLCVMPLFHVHGLVASTLAPLHTGGTIVLVPRFNPLSFWTTVRQYGVTWFSAVPTIHQMLLNRSQGKARPKGAEQLRFIRSCSAALPPTLMLELEARFGVPVLEAYGMTEAAHQMASNPLPPGVRKPGSVGRGTGVNIAILGDTGEILPTGNRGAVAINGPSVFDGYEGNTEANAESFVNGWFLTGDEGVLDADGYLTLLGRAREMINRGGEKISPREIDETLLGHPAVDEAVAFGLPHRVYGEEVAAAVVLKDRATEKELIDHCRAHMADFKCPKTIYIVDAIPRGATGKLQRRSVAAQVANQDK